MDRNRFKTNPIEEFDAARPISRPLGRVRPTGEITPPAPVRPVRPPEPARPRPETLAAPVISQPAAVEPVDLSVVEPVSVAPPKQHLFKISRFGRSKAVGVAIAGVLLVASGALILSRSGSDKTALKGATANASVGLHVAAGGVAANSSATVSGTVPFTPLVPKDKPQLARLGSSAYNAQYKSYSFDDTFEAQKIRVSEQELPSGQTSAAGLIDKISASLKPQSLQPFTLPNGQPAYLLNATSQAGAQVIIFTVKGLLFFVQSGTTHDADTWINYIANLQ